MTVNIETKEIGTIKNQDKGTATYDLRRVPGNDDYPYYILHETSGLYLIDPQIQKDYILKVEHNEELYHTCKSLAVSQVDPNDKNKGFWLVNIDVAEPDAPVINCYVFNAEFLYE